MIALRTAGSRGYADHGWLQSWHSFSFADYYDPAEMGWGALRVINEDVVAPGEGFPMHGHRDMEIVTVILAGALEHRDSLGNGAVIRPGEVQRMSAGLGVRHSEFNPSPEVATHLLQIWIRPARSGATPGYEQREISLAPGATLLASPDGRDGSVAIGQDATLQRVRLVADEIFVPDLAPDRFGYAHLISGVLETGDFPLSTGDGLKAHDAPGLRLTVASAADFLWFDLPA